jgi:hypothetical protein
MIFFLNIVLTVFLLILPGYTLCQFLFSKLLQRWVLPFRIVIYVIFSLSIIFLYSFILGEISAPFFIKRILAFLLVFMSVLLIIIKKLKNNKTDYIKNIGKFPFILFLYTTLLFVVWMFCIYHQPYPGILSEGTGDEPEYYVLAKNIYLGRGFTTDYFIGDFWTGPRHSISDVIGSPPNSGRRPLAPYIAGYFFYITGQNNYIIGIIAVTLTALLPLCFYSFLYHYTLNKNIVISNIRNVIYQLVAIITCLFPSIFSSCALGCVTSFEIIPFFVFVMLLSLKDWDSLDTIIISSICAGLTTISRPEGNVLIFAAFLVFMLPPVIQVIFRKKKLKKLIIISAVISGIIIMNIPVLFIQYGTTSGLWLQTIIYDTDIKSFESSYYPWSQFNYAITKVNFSENPEFEKLLNPNLIRDIISHPIEFGSWVIGNASSRFVAFFNLYILEHSGKPTVSFTPLELSDYSVDSNHDIVDKILIQYFTNSGTIKCIVLCVFMALYIITGTAWQILLILYLFVLGFFLLSPVLYVRQAFVMSPLIIFALLVGISTKSKLRDGAYLLFIKFINNICHIIKKLESITHFHSLPSSINLSLELSKPGILVKKEYDETVVKIIIISLLLLCLTLIILETNEFNNSVILNDINRMYLPYIELANKYTEPSSVVVCGYPQLINLATRRICIGSSFLFEILNYRLEKFSPDYILIDEVNFAKSRQLSKREIQQNKIYIKQYYDIAYHDLENHIMLYKHK